jgi:CHAT domain-containing protein
MGDICSQSLRASLVTLSSCETGLSEIAEGEEVIGLSRGFLTAGAASIVLSLWTVNDSATADLMKDLYRRLQRGETVPASLRAAQRNLIEKGQHPFYWSPFMAIGK